MNVATPRLQGDVVNRPQNQTIGGSEADIVGAEAGVTVGVAAVVARLHHMTVVARAQGLAIEATTGAIVLRGARQEVQTTLVRDMMTANLANLDRHQGRMGWTLPNPDRSGMAQRLQIDMVRAA